MKLNKIFMAFAAVAMVGCSSEDVSDFSANQAIDEAGLVQLDDNFVFAGVGEEDAITRTHWEWEGTPNKSPLINKFLPIWGTTAPDGSGNIDKFAKLEEQAVGLCWLSDNVGKNVYTNYEFYHFGWLNKGETEAKVECKELKNGSFYDEITAKTGTANKEAVPGTDWTVAELPAKSVKAGNDNLNYNSGIYKTENAAIFGGQYIVYYPYNPEFNEVGTIPAIAETVFGELGVPGKGVSQNFDTPEIGKATFRYSSPVTVKGGVQSSGFGLYNLSTLVQLRVACPKGDAAIGQMIDQIVLYSKSGKLLKQANLAADKIAAGKKGAELYDATEGTKTIVANFAAPVALAATDGTVTSAFITVLPTEVEDLEVLVHSTTLKQWARVDMAGTEFEAGKAKRLDITVKKANFTSDYIAVDQASLATALTNAEALADATHPATIEVIGDITLTANMTINNAQDEFITIKGDAIIVPEDKTLQVQYITIESDIRVLGKECCGTATYGGRLEIAGGATTLNNITMEPTEATVADEAEYIQRNPMVTFAYDADPVTFATIAAGKTFDVQAGTVVVNDAVQHKGDIKIAEGASLTVYGTNEGVDGDLNFMGSTVVNDGTIEVKKDGNFDMTDEKGDASATDGKRMTNNGTFIHNVDAGVGTAVQSMNQNGEYRCKVNAQTKLDDAYLQWTACNIIEIVGAGDYDLKNFKKHKHQGVDKHVDIEVYNGGDTNFTMASNGDGKNIEIGNLTVKSALNINYITDNKNTNPRTLTVHGDMAVKANTNINGSNKIVIDKNLEVEGGTLYYKGGKLTADGKTNVLWNSALTVGEDITVSGATFDAFDTNALNITCKNFTLADGATAKFGNRTDGDAWNMKASGTITNPKGCTFNIREALGAGSVIGVVTCTKLVSGGTFTNSRPLVVE